MRPHERTGATRPGFSMVELLFTLTVIAVLVGLSMPSLTGALIGSRASNAATVVASDLRMAFSLAARQGRPVRITFDAGSDSYRITDRSSGDVLHSRRLGDESEFPLSGVAFSVTPIDVFPKRVASSALTVTLSAGSETATVEMSSVGHVEVEES